jgi:3-oxoacyl-[acyl-carrier protein] reductase
MVETVVITGASKGIGLATAHMLSENGVCVIGIARSQPQQEFPGDFYAANLSDRIETAQVMEKINASHAIDGIVNNVGLNIIEPLGSVDLDHFDRVIDLNVRASIQITQSVLPGMRERHYGRIVNLSSRGALGREGRTSYSAAKAGLVGITRTWALELARVGITANVVSPGPTATEMFRRNNLSGPQAAENEKRFLADVPMDRFGEVDEIAFGICFFLDRRASFITGQVLNVCGGSSVGISAL